MTISNNFYSIYFRLFGYWNGLHTNTHRPLKLNGNLFLTIELEMSISISFAFVVVPFSPFLIDTNYIFNAYRPDWRQTHIDQYIRYKFICRYVIHQFKSREWKKREEIKPQISDSLIFLLFSHHPPNCQPKQISYECAIDINPYGMKSRCKGKRFEQREKMKKKMNKTFY